MSGAVYLVVVLFICLLVERRSLSLAWSWPNKLSWLVSEPQESFSAGIVSMCLLVQWISGLNLGP